MARCWMRLLLLLFFVPWITSCQQRALGPNQDQPAAQAPVNRLAEQQRQAAAQAQAARQRAQERCLRERPSLEAQMAALRRAEVQLARVKEDSYVPLPAPDPWDELRESRYRQEDREADWQRHQQAQEAWQQREQSHRASWLANHQARLQRAQERLDREAQELRARRPDLFTGPRSIEFNPEVAHRVRHCSDSVAETGTPAQDR